MVELPAGARPTFRSRAVRQAVANDDHGDDAIISGQDDDANAGQTALHAHHPRFRSRAPPVAQGFQAPRAQVLAEHMGLKKTKKKVRRARERTQFKFDWDASEDTTSTTGVGKMDSMVLGFHNRGHLGGMAPDPAPAQGRAVARQMAQTLLTKPAALMSRRDWRIFKANQELAISGGGGHDNVPPPARTWQEMGLPEALADAVAQLYRSPSVVQMQCIPLGLQPHGGRDVIAVAKTGSGKTCAFILPMLVYAASQPPMTPERALEGPYALVMAPTRELVQQISLEANKFAAAMPTVKVFAMVGGVDIGKQAFDAAMGFQCLVATPGRLADAVAGRYLVLNQCRYVVLDEADVMVDLGLAEDMLRVLDAMPASNLKPFHFDHDNKSKSSNGGGDHGDDGDGYGQYRQTLMFSATMPRAMEHVMRQHLRSPVTVRVGNTAAANDNVEQVVRWTTPQNKHQQVVALIRSSVATPAILFANTHRDVETLACTMQRNGISQVAVLHAHKPVAQRERALQDFRSGRASYLVCTDVASRGLDIAGVKYVVNVDMPPSAVTYVHRIGRTGRAGLRGTAVSLATADDVEVLKDVYVILRESKHAVIPHEMHQLVRAANRKHHRSTTVVPI